MDGNLVFELGAHLRLLTGCLGRTHPGVTGKGEGDIPSIGGTGGTEGDILSLCRKLGALGKLIATLTAASKSWCQGVRLGFWFFGGREKPKTKSDP